MKILLKDFGKVNEALKTAKEFQEEFNKLSTNQKYEDIRKSKTNVEAISKNTGYKEENIQKCKNHLFYDTHKLDRYEPTEIKRFDPNENQANAWHTKEDLIWFKHDKTEYWYEKRHKAGYSESHEAAQKHFGILRVHKIIF